LLAEQDSKTLWLDLYEICGTGELIKFLKVRGLGLAHLPIASNDTVTSAV